MLANEFRYLLTWLSLCGYFVAALLGSIVLGRTLHAGAPFATASFFAAVLLLAGGWIAWNASRASRGIARAPRASADAPRVAPGLIALAWIGLAASAVWSSVGGYRATGDRHTLDVAGMALLSALGGAWLQRGDLRRLFGLRPSPSTLPPMAARVAEIGAIVTSRDPQLRSLRLRIVGIVRLALLLGFVPAFFVLVPRVGTTLAAAITVAVFAVGGIGIKRAMGLKDGLLL